MTSLSISSPGAMAQLHVDLGALKENYQTLAALAGSSQCAGVVKADAYGLGVEPISRALWQVGCRIFFVAILSEAAVLRNLLPDAEIYLLNGLIKGAAPECARLNVRPILASFEEIEEWSLFCRGKNVLLPAAVHVDTGINRLGIEYGDAVKYFQSASAFQDFKLCMVMSHLACGDEPSNPLNQQQVKKFEALRAFATDVVFSLANSAGIISSPDTYFDMVRPGIALYGSNPIEKSDTHIKSVATLNATILQVRDVAVGQSVGYGGTFTCQRPSKVAILGLGYADGFFRNLGGSNAQIRAHVDIGGHLAPVIGRVSMDMIGVDVTDLPDDSVSRAGIAEVFGEKISLDGVAQASQTLSYEVLTRLGNRFDRIYR